MPYEKRPVNPVGKNYVPPSSVPYRVQDGDGWKRVAQRHRVDPWDLIYLNFKTRKPTEVNWYLHNYVGCTKKTRDGKNWMFSSEADPGIIHIPIPTIQMPPMIIEGKVPPKLMKVWAGLAKSHSGDLFIVGAHDLTGKIYNLGDDMPEVRNTWININGWKFGAGLGASVSAVFVIAHGYANAPEMNGVAGGWDFDVALIAKLSSVLKGIKGLGKAVDTYEKYKKMRYLTENTIKSIGIHKPGVYTIPIPFAGAGVHLWGGYKFGDVRVRGMGTGIP